MRCPKCGYISFDHLDKCLKCNKDIQVTSSGLFGSAYKVPAPPFLRLEKRTKEDTSLDEDFLEEFDDVDTEDYIDEELEILVEEDNDDTESEISMQEDDDPHLEFSDEDEQEEEEGEIEIDFSQFKDEDAGESERFGEAATTVDFGAEEDEDAESDDIAQLSRAIEIPEELTDISDLAPPTKKPEVEKASSGPETDADLLDLELDDLQFDLGLDELDEVPASKAEIPEEAILALDEIDFSETLAESNSLPAKSGSSMDMDEDLNFDLDLGGLSIHKDI